MARTRGHQPLRLSLTSIPNLYSCGVVVGKEKSNEARRVRRKDKKKIGGKVPFPKLSGAGVRRCPTERAHNPATTNMFVHTEI